MVKITTRCFNVTSLERHKDKRISGSGQYDYGQYESRSSVCSMLDWNITFVGGPLLSGGFLLSGTYRNISNLTVLFWQALQTGNCYFRNSFFRKLATIQNKQSTEVLCTIHMLIPGNTSTCSFKWSCRGGRAGRGGGEETFQT